MSNMSETGLPATDAYPEMERLAKDAYGDSLDYIDELPDGPGKKLIIPFPFGPGKARPYGWGLYPDLHPSTDDDDLPRFSL